MGSYYSRCKNMITKPTKKRRREHENEHKLDDDELSLKQQKKRSKKRRKLQKKRSKDELLGGHSLPTPPVSPQVTIILSDSEDYPGNSSNHGNGNHHGNARENKILFTTTNKISLTQRDLLTLRPSQWLNDTIIDFSLKMIADEYDKENTIFISSSFFFTKLQLAKERKADLYKELKAWVNCERLRKCSAWYIPVCQKNHWFLIVVALPAVKRPFIYVMDSLNKKRMAEAKLVREFLQQLYLKELSDRPLKKPKIYQAKIPQQQNTTDCGLHLIRSFEISILRNKFITRLMKGKIADQNRVRQFWSDHPVISRNDLEYQILKYAMNHSED